MRNSVDLGSDEDARGGSDSKLQAEREARSLEHTFVLVALLFAAVAIVCIGLAVEPDQRGHGTHEQFGLPACGWITDYGIPCPGCGVTTSISLSMHGRLADSLRNQPFGFLLSIAIPLLGVVGLGLHCFTRSDFARWLTPRRVFLGSVLIALFASAAWLYALQQWKEIHNG